MTLSLQWRNKIDMWRGALQEFLFVELGEVSLEGFITREQLSCQEACARPMDAIPAGTAWGAKWEYAWFRGRFALPPEADGQYVVLKPDVGGESAVYLDGRVVGAVDRQHHEILLGNPARAKEKLGWEPRTTFEDMVAEMAREDLALSMRDAVCKVAGFKTFSHNE